MTLWIHLVVIRCHNSTTWKVIMFLCVLIELNVFWAKFHGCNCVWLNWIKKAQLQLHFIPATYHHENREEPAWSRLDGVWVRWELNNIIAKPQRLLSFDGAKRKSKKRAKIMKLNFNAFAARWCLEGKSSLTRVEWRELRSSTQHSQLLRLTFSLMNEGCCGSVRPSRWALTMIRQSVGRKNKW